jgi:hypothetical protein
MAFVFGEVNKPKPKPSIAKDTVMYVSEVVCVIKTIIIIEMRVMLIPSEASFPASILSLKRPVSGAVMAIIAGCITNTSPASPGLNIFEYCKYKLSKKLTPKVDE